MESANLIEIFHSFQGEGPYVGQPMNFVRFQNCAFSCEYCDTPDSFKTLPEFKLESPPGSGEFVQRFNPLKPDQLTKLLESFPKDPISLTGGEPLQHAEFLASWLPAFNPSPPVGEGARRADEGEPLSPTLSPEGRGRKKILLETAGILYRELEKVIDHLDIISMDFKLPSVTGMKGYWEEHTQFLKIAKKKEVYVKIVLSEKTDLEELQQATQIVKEHAPQIPLILQPVTPHGPVKESISPQRLQQCYEVAQILPDVRVIPQIHPQLKIL